MKRCHVLGLGVLAGLLGLPLVAHAEPMVALKGSNVLAAFDSATPGTLQDLAVQGIAAGDVLVSIDLRPDNGILYGLTNTGNFYSITLGANPATAVKQNNAAVTVPAAFAIDFNPAADRLRVVGGATNLRIDPNNGSLAGTDTNLSYPLVGTDCTARDGINTPQIVGAAYRNNFGGANGFNVTTAPDTLLQYGIDARTSQLVTMGGANLNDGCVRNVGPLNVTLAAGSVGFDISPGTRTAYLSATVSGATSLYTVNLATGAAVAVGAFPAGSGVLDIAARGAPKAAQVWGLTRAGTLIPFTASNSFSTGVPVTVSGLGDKTLKGLDYRPKTGQLYAFGTNGTSGQVFLLGRPTTQSTTLAATLVGAAFSVEGTNFGVDFNPVADAIRIVSDTGKNYRFALATSALTTDTDLDALDGPAAAGTPFGTGVAYTNNLPAPTSTRILLIDPRSQSLYSQGSKADGGVADAGPNGGELFFVGPTGVATSAGVAADAGGGQASVGFDIDETGTAFAVITGTSIIDSVTYETSRIYEVDLTPSTGPLVRWGRAIGGLGQGSSVLTGIAVEVPVPEQGDGGADAGPDSGVVIPPRPDSGTTPPVDSGTRTDSGTTPRNDAGTAPPGEEDDGGCDCSTVPSTPAAPGALALAIATLYFVRRKRNRK